jgi:hypothetical protein
LGYLVVQSEGYLIAVAQSREVQSFSSFPFVSLLLIRSFAQEVTLPGGAVLRTVLRTATIRIPLTAATSASFSVPSSPAPHEPSDSLPNTSPPLPIRSDSTHNVPSQHVSLLAPSALAGVASGSLSRKPSVLELLEGVFDFAYYYCETADATSHFPNLKTDQK